MQQRCDIESMLSRRHFFKISGFSVGTLALGSLINPKLGFGKDIYPANKIIYIVSNAPGGGTDLYARAISPYLSKYLTELSPDAKGSGIVVRNEPAGGGRKGYSMIFTGNPDGYTIGSMDTGLITDSIIDKGGSDFGYSKLTFLSLASSSTKVILAHKKGFNSWEDAKSAMKKEPIKIAVGSFGRANHVSAIIMIEKAGAKFKMITFPGTPQSMNALIRGDVQLALASEDSAKGVIDAKEVKVILQFTDASDYPGAASIKDIGYPDLADKISSHRFIIAPPGLQAQPKRLLLSALKKATADPNFMAWAKKCDVPLSNIYGEDAEKMFTKFVTFYQELAPSLKKHLA